MKNTRELYEERMTEQQALVELPESGTSLTLLQKVYRCDRLPLSTRMRAAMAALQFEHPKLGVSVVYNGEDLAARLDKAIERSNGAKLIEGSTNGQSAEVIEHDRAELVGLMPSPPHLKRRV